MKTMLRLGSERDSLSVVNDQIGTPKNTINLSSYPTPASRPAFSVLDKSKIKRIFGLEVREWEENLKSTKTY